MRDDVGEVELALGVLGLQRGDARGEHVGLEHVDAGVDLAEVEFLRGRVLLLDDSGDMVTLANDAPVAGRVGHDRGEDGDRVALDPVGGDQFLQGLPGQQRHIARRDHHRPGDVRKRRQACADRVQCPTVPDRDRHVGCDFGEVTCSR